MGSVIQLPPFVSTESLSMTLPALKHLWALEFLKLQSDSLIVLLVQMIRNHLVQSNADSASSVCLFFSFLPFSIVFFCLWLRKSDSFIEFLLCFFSFYNKGIQMLFVCARYESLCTCLSTSSCNLNHTHTHKKRARYKLCSPSSRSPHSQVWAGGLVLVKALFGVSGLLQNCTAALRVGKSPPKLFWRAAFQ